MAKVKFVKSGESYVLPEELYNLVVTKVEKVEKAEYWGYKFIFSVMDEEELSQGNGTTLGKSLNLVFWASNDDKAKKVYKETGDFTFPPTGKFANACRALAKSKNIDIANEDFDPERDLVGCICKGMTKNETSKDGDATYSNLDSNSIREATSKTVAAYEDWKKWRKSQKSEKEEPKKVHKDEPKVEKTKKVVEDDDDFEDEKPVKKSKPVEDDDDFEDEKPAKKKKPVEDDDDLFD